MIRLALLNAAAAPSGSVRVDQRAVESTTAPRSPFASRVVLTALRQTSCVPEPTVAALGYPSGNPRSPRDSPPTSPARAQSTPARPPPPSRTLRRSARPTPTCQLSLRLCRFRDDSWPVLCRFRSGSLQFVAVPPPNIARLGASAILMPKSGNGVGRNPARPVVMTLCRNELTDGFPPF